MSTGDIVYKVDVDEKGATAGVKNFDKSIDEMGKTSGKANTAHTSLWKQVAVGAIAYKAATVLVRAFKDAIMDSIDAAIEQEKADKALSASLEITGRPVKALADHFKAYASELQKSTVYGDEAIQGAQALLIQLTDLDKNGIDRATKGTIGLASVMGMDLNSATNLVAKALSGNVGALSRYGIQVSKTGTEEEKRAEILEKLEQFYGRATAETETYGGKLAVLKNKYGDLQEEVGKLVTSSTFWMTTLDSMIDVINDVLTVHNKLDAAIRNENESTMNSVKRFREMATAAGLSGEEIRALSVKYKDVNDVGIKHEKMMRDILKVHPELKKQMQDGADASAKAAKELEKLTKGTNKFGDEGEDAAKAAEHQAKAIDKLEKEMKAADKRLEDWNKDVVKGNSAADKFNSTLDQMGDEFAGGGVAAQWFAQNLQKLGWESNKQAGKLSQDWVTALDTWMTKWNETLETTKSALGAIDQAINQTYQNKLIRMDTDYQKQLEYIKSSTMSEQEKQEAITALEAEYEMKRREVAVSQAKSQKATALVTAGINIAQAITKALTGAIPPWNFILAGLTAAAGAVQLAAIKSAPIPLAKGAIFKQPTLLAGNNGRDYEVAEAGESEIVASPSNIRKALDIDGGSRPIYIRNSIYLDGRLMKEFTIKAIEDAAATGRLSLRGKAVN